MADFYLLVEQGGPQDFRLKLVNLDQVRLVEFTNGINLIFDSNYKVSVQGAGVLELFSTLMGLTRNHETAGVLKDLLLENINSAQK